MAFYVLLFSPRSLVLIFGVFFFLVIISKMTLNVGLFETCELSGPNIIVRLSVK
jgi:hypothetical protein